MTLALVATSVFASPVAAAGTVGSGFVVSSGDISFILKQIKIAERHAATYTPANPCGTLVGPGPHQIPDYLTSYGLRTVDGSCNNLVPGRERFAAADEIFPRLTTAVYRNLPPVPTFPVPSVSSYSQPGNTVDEQPRIISNLIVDQTSTNPAAVAAAGFPVRAQAAATGVFACSDPPVATDPVGCVPAHKTLFMENVTTDVGLSPPYNSLFTFFGQFFDHGVDQTVKTGATSFVPLRADDPLITLGPDGVAGTGDEVPPSQAFMVLTRTEVLPGPDGVLGTSDDGASNTDTPWVDQSQTYTSHPSHQVFLREYTTVGGKPVATGKLLGGLAAGLTYAGSPDGTLGIGTWAAVKQQAAQKLGLQLVDRDVTNIPMLAVDPYGNFIPGPNGFPQYATASGLVEGNPAANGGLGVPVPANVLHFNTPFVGDIAHNADPSMIDTNHDGTPDTFPTPDADNTPSADFAHQPAGTYDDELLNAHFSCGDGRCNENIALSTVHQIFHSEHDRLVDDISNTLHQPANAALLADFQAVNPTSTDPETKTFTLGERYFQAARFVTEMEYQHLVFEEFARKIQPAVRPFHLYHTDINAAIPAEFAHAVYRFGHSMLDDTVARKTVDPVSGAATDRSLSLLTAFLNPPMFFNTTADTHGNPIGSTYNAEEAAGAVVMGSSDQSGNELDEFVTETLRNNLLGLPLDLPTINMTRAREAGVPPLNNLRRQIFGKTGDSQLAPYTSWSDYGQHLKHPESLINFVAAYGLHPSITSATTLADKRAAARAIVDPVPVGSPVNPAGDTPPADAADFMLSNGAWANNADGSTTTGLDDVDLWVGGLAEVTNLFGGLLGSTFNYVFQSTLENLQDGDRLYYLARTPGMNLRTQLEGNSFSELILRNTQGTQTLKADAFATADCKFELSHLAGTPAGFTTFGATVADDPTSTDCDESLLLTRSPDGTIAYKQRNTVDPTGINGQSVYNGTDGVDRVKGGNDNDTIWGGLGGDVIDGQGGDDVVKGGLGNDRINDLDGADVLEGGPGNDAIDAGPGDDIILSNDGVDFTNGASNDNETFAGEGDDFIIAGQGADAVFGDGGNDWIEGGSGQDLLQGDHGAPFFDDPAESAPGNDIFVGQVGENDYDAEGGDDLMAQNAAVDRNAGAGGFDWAFHQYNTVAANDDMMVNNFLVGVPIQLVVNRDRWQETEADSGYNFNDTIKGTDGALATPRLVGGGGFTGCDALDEAAVARISGLAAILPPVSAWVGTAADVAAASASGFCPLTGPVWGEGDILIGGLGSDTIEGRAGNDIIDGDRYLTVAISVRTNPADPTTEIGRTDLMENVATSGNFGPGTTGMTLQAAVFAGLVDPGNLIAVRQIVTPTAAQATGNIDTAVFSGALSAYTITSNGDGSVTVDSNGGADGIDTLRNIEKLQFADQLVDVASFLTPTPAAGLSAASLTFASQTTGTSSAVQSITLTNSGTANLVISGVTITGANAGDFTRTTTCTTVVPGSTCTISVTFTPTAAGSRTASVSIASNLATSPSIGLTGTATAAPPAPIAGFSATTLAFGNQSTGTTGTRTITVTNTGTANLVVSGATLTGTNANQFTATRAAGCASIAPAGSCTITVTFTPTTAGGKTASLSIAHNATGSPATVALTGTGVVTTTASMAASLQVSPNTRINTTTTKTITVTNTGTNALTITGVTVAGGPIFTANVGTCTTAIAAGRTCKINVTFAPTAVGTFTGSVAIVSNASNNPSTALSGTSRR